MAPRNAPDPRHPVDAATEAVLSAAFKVHSFLGPGLLESAYEACLAHELVARGHHVRRQEALPVRYGETVVDAGYRLDLVVDDSILVEVKSIRAFAPIHHAQVLTYLRLSGLRVGLLLNFNRRRLSDGGIRRLVQS